MQGSEPDVPARRTTSPTRPSSGRSGARSSRSTRASSSRSSRSSSTTSCSTGRRSATRCAAVGFNPEAARYGGISVSRNYILAMGISGAFAGLAGAVDMLGWKFHQAINDFDVSTVGFIGIAVALLGRNKAVGILFAALLFGALQVGTSPRQLDRAPTSRPSSRRNLSTMIQALIILFVGAELLIVYALEPAQAGRLLRGAAAQGERAELCRCAGSTAAVLEEPPWLRRLAETRSVAIYGIVLGILAFWLALPPWDVRFEGGPIALGIAGARCGIWAVVRDERRLGWWAVAVAIAGTAAALWAQTKGTDSLDAVVTAGLFAATIRFATPLAFAAMGGIFSERSGVVNIGLEGMMLSGAFFGIWAAAWSGSWVVGILMAMVFGGLLALIHAFFSHPPPRRPDRERIRDQLPRPRAHRLPLPLHLRHEGTPSDVSRIPDVTRAAACDKIPFIGDIIGHHEPDDLAHVRASRSRRGSCSSRRRSGCGSARSASIRGRPTRSGSPSTASATRCVIALGDAGRPRRRVPLDRLRRIVQREHDRRPRLHRARGGDLRQVAPVRRPSRPRCSSAFERRSRSASSARRTSRPTLSTLPYVLTLIALVGVIGRSSAARRPSAAPTSSSEQTTRRRSWAVRRLALAALARARVAVALAAHCSGDVGLYAGDPAAVPIGLVAALRVSFAWRAARRLEHQRTLGRVGGARLATAARILGRLRASCSRSPPRSPWACSRC